MNAPHEEAAEFAKQSKRENRVYVGNLSYDVKYRDLMEFMRGGGLRESQISFSMRFRARRGVVNEPMRVRGGQKCCSSSGVAAAEEFLVLIDGWRE